MIKNDLFRFWNGVEHFNKSFEEGDYIANQNDKVANLYLLVKGRVKTEIVSETGFVLPLEELSAPYPLAIAFLFANNNSFPVDVVALEKCEVIAISKESVERKMMESQEFLREFMSFMANHMQYLSQRLKLFAHRGIKAKFVYYLTTKDIRGYFNLERSVTSLAAYLGVERPSLSRAISEMVEDKIITFHRGKGMILNYQKLQRILG